MKTFLLAVSAIRAGLHLVVWCATGLPACLRNLEMSLIVPFRNVTVAGFGRRAGAEPMRSAAPDRRPPRRSPTQHPFLTERASA
jgi:hypothetical protein